MTSQQHDIRHMRHALRLAERALGTVAPNPAVGCVIVSASGHIVGRGWTQSGGRPHAETVALAQAGDASRGGTAYVSLEPCAHHGVTPPCSDALISVGVARVVGAVVDPDPRVSGQGFARLEAAGVAVTCGVLEKEAAALNAGFFRRVGANRPLVALKIAQSVDGFVADANGRSKWITSEQARRHGQLLRARYDAILVGIGTVLADDPALTCRLPGLEKRSPLRVVLDSQLRLPPVSQLASTAAVHPTIVFTTVEKGGEELAAQGIEIVRMPQFSRPTLHDVLATLARRGITRLLVEGGPTIHGAFVQDKLVDVVHVYRAPLVLGAGGRPAVQVAQSLPLSQAPRLHLIERQVLGPDVLESFSFTV
jgi:diaminohydroxyphosphoribosylaminopyrimidine deaminase/5-amino-6-(5-phosphoribosylamino)uracil reductase